VLRDKDFCKPIVVISKCINFEHTRYDASIIKDEFALKLGKFVQYIPICPEVEIGLGIPRDPIIIVKKEKFLLYQPKTQKDLTSDMEYFSKSFLSSLQNNVDGFLLKSKSPSCAVKNANFYSDINDKNPIGKTSGMFAKAVLERFPYLPIEDEKRLIDFGIRNLFFTRIFVNSSLRNLKENLTKAKLIEFHSQNKLLLMAYSQKNLQILGKLLSNLKEESLHDTYEKYATIFRSTFKKSASKGSHVNTLLHALGYFKEKISSKEKAHFLDLIQSYINGNSDIFTVIELILNFSIRFNEEYLLKQSYLNPYPRELRFL